MMKNMENNVIAKKAALRKELLKKRSDINEVEAYKKSRKICESIISTEAFKNAEFIFAYMPIRNEVHILPVIEAGFDLRKRIAFPKCLDKKGHMAFFEVSQLSDLSSGAFGIMEPAEGCPMVDVVEKSETINGIMLVPGVGFDSTKNRLGYGGGYYDRFIGANKSICYIAPAYELQVVENIPTEPYDRCVDIIVTENKIW